MGQDAANPRRIVEQFVVASWSEHLRQHERVTVRDHERLDAIRSMTDPEHPTVVTSLADAAIGQLSRRQLS